MPNFFYKNVSVEGHFVVPWHDPYKMLLTSLMTNQTSRINNHTWGGGGAFKAI